MELAFEISVPNVTGEIIDGEAIVLNLKSGHYFSMDGSAALVWGGIEQRLPPSRIAGEVAGRFGIDPGLALADVQKLLDELLEHDLIRPAPAAADHDAGLDLTIAPSAYSAPSLEIYTDLRDLLLLDPIHDVDEAGWPVAQAETRL
jgi:hypothetical protein